MCFPAFQGFHKGFGTEPKDPQRNHKVSFGNEMNLSKLQFSQIVSWGSFASSQSPKRTSSICEKRERERERESEGEKALERLAPIEGWLSESCVSN